MKLDLGNALRIFFVEIGRKLIAVIAKEKLYPKNFQFIARTVLTNRV